MRLTLALTFFFILSGTSEISLANQDLHSLAEPLEASKANQKNKCDEYKNELRRLTSQDSKEDRWTSKPISPDNLEAIIALVQKDPANSDIYNSLSEALERASGSSKGNHDQIEKIMERYISFPSCSLTRSLIFFNLKESFKSKSTPTALKQKIKNLVDERARKIGNSHGNLNEVLTIIGVLSDLEALSDSKSKAFRALYEFAREKKAELDKSKNPQESDTNPIFESFHRELRLSSLLRAKLKETLN